MLPPSHLSHHWWVKYGHSKRGLEHLFNSNTHYATPGAARQEKVKAVIQSVLKEQKKGGDERKIARLYEQLTKSAKSDALSVGANDESVAMGILLPEVAPPLLDLDEGSGGEEKKDSGGSLDIVKPRVLFDDQQKHVIDVRSISTDSDSSSPTSVLSFKKKAAGFGQDDGAQLAILAGSWGD
jgi:hypothetical protein